MPLIEIDNDLKDVNVEEYKNEVKWRTQEELQTSIRYNKEIPLEAIINVVKGYEWDVTYFQQVRNVNDMIDLPDIKSSISTQKYNRIDNLILYLQSPIEQEEVTNIQGEAIINAGFLPNVHDVFLAELTGGRQAIFAITNIRKNDYNLHAVYRVEFKLYIFIDSNPDIYNNIIYKVVQGYVYNKDFIINKSAPLITATDYSKKLNLEKIIPILTEYYFKHFLDKSCKFFKYPSKNKKQIAIDSLLTNFIFKIIDINDTNFLYKINILDYSPNVMFSIWDVLLQQNIDLLNHVDNDLGFIYCKTTRGKLLTKSMYYLNVQFVLDNLKDNDYSITTKTLALEDDIEGINIHLDNTYVLSKHFYNRDKEKCSLIEQLLFDYIEHKVIDISNIYKILEEYRQWSNKTKFYYIPILILLIKYASSYIYKKL